MFGEKNYSSANTGFSIVEAYNDSATRIQNNADITGVLHMFFDTVFKVVTQYFCRVWSVLELGNFCRIARAIKRKVKITFFSMVIKTI